MINSAGFRACFAAKAMPMQSATLSHENAGSVTSAAWAETAIPKPRATRYYPHPGDPRKQYR